MAFESFKKINFLNRTASIGTSHKELYKKIPAALREGKKAAKNGGLFDYYLVIQRTDPRSASGDPAKIHVEQDNITKETAIYMSDDIYRDLYLGFFKRKFTDGSQAYNQISSSFFKQIGDGVTRLVQKGGKPAMLVAPFEPGSIGTGTDIIPAATASFNFTHPGIVNSTTGKCVGTINNTSTNALYGYFVFSAITSSLNNAQAALTSKLVSIGRPHLTRSFQKNNFAYIQPKYIPKWGIEYTPHTPGAGAFALTSSFSSSADKGITSGSVLLGGGTGLGNNYSLRNYNGQNANDGAYFRDAIKGFISGEGEFGEGEDNENLSFFPSKTMIFFPSSSVVRSGSFRYVPFSSGAAHATASTDVREIFYISGSGISESFQPSSGFGNAAFKVSGSHIWSNSTLTTPADDGFYFAGEQIGGFNRIYGCFKGENSVTASIPDTDDGDHVPRFSSQFVISI